jgi:RND family efflux transporter MFP subunit
MKTLREEGVATQSEFERAQLGYEMAKNALQAATQGAAASAAQAEAAHAGVQASRDSSQQLVKMIEDSTLRAPFSGSITSRDAEVGNVVGPGGRIFGLIGEGAVVDHRLKITFELPESIVQSVATGTEITLEVLACGSEISTTVATIGPSIKSDSRTVDYTAYIPSDTPCVLPGMFGNVRIPLEIHENAILLPDEAVIELQEGKFVYVVKGDTAERRQVQTGIRDSGKIEITEGIAQTDRVIVVGNRFLTNGARITIQQETPGGAAGDQQPGTGGAN